MERREQISPELLAKFLGQQFSPSEEQAAVTGAAPGPLLVVAGAGAGKTETMAARVVWLVANGYVDPNQVLGLTFTRKAAQQLRQRITNRLRTLAGIPEGRLARFHPDPARLRALEDVQPTVATYDAYAGTILREYGLLLPVEPGARVLSQTELFQLALRLVRSHEGTLRHQVSPESAAENLIDLYTELNNHRVTPADIREETGPFVQQFEDLPRARRQSKNLNQTLVGWRGGRRRGARPRGAGREP